MPCYNKNSIAIVLHALLYNFLRIDLHNRIIIIIMINVL